ncbi:MAG: helix-turn-helix transcriptional regulator [Cyanobacteria bacterium P01_D01_bin.50]
MLILLARVGKTPAFNYQDIADLSGVCTHISACMATLNSQETIFTSTLSDRERMPKAYRLTRREIQIAQLVARGLTNKEIGVELWITQNSVKQALKRMFRKLEVSSRTEMITKLQDILNEPN